MIKMRIFFFILWVIANTHASNHGSKLEKWKRFVAAEPTGPSCVEVHFARKKGTSLYDLENMITSSRMVMLQN